MKINALSKLYSGRIRLLRLYNGPTQSLSHLIHLYHVWYQIKALSKIFFVKVFAGPCFDHLVMNKESVKFRVFRQKLAIKWIIYNSIRNVSHYRSNYRYFNTTMISKHQVKVIWKPLTQLCNILRISWL